MELARNIVNAFPKIFKGLGEEERKISHEQQVQDLDYDFCEDNEEMLADDESSYVLLDLSSPQNVEKIDERSSHVFFESQNSESQMTGSIVEGLFSSVHEHEISHTTISGTTLAEDQESVVSVNNTEKNSSIIDRPPTPFPTYSVSAPTSMEVYLGNATLKTGGRFGESTPSVNINEIVLNNSILETLEDINTASAVRPSSLNQEGIFNDKVISSAEMPVTDKGPILLQGSSEVRLASPQAEAFNVVAQRQGGNIHEPNNPELHNRVVVRQDLSSLNQERILSDRLVSNAELQDIDSLPASFGVQLLSSEINPANVDVIAEQITVNIPGTSVNNTELNSNVVVRHGPLNLSGAISAPLIFSQEMIQNPSQVVTPIDSPAPAIANPISSLSRADVKKIRMRGPY